MTVNYRGETVKIDDYSQIFNIKLNSPADAEIIISELKKIDLIKSARVSGNWVID